MLDLYQMSGVYYILTKSPHLYHKINTFHCYYYFIKYLKSKYLRNNKLKTWRLQNMKKYLAAFVLVLVCASGAMAYQNNGTQCSQSGARMNMKRSMENATPEMKTKFQEVKKLHEELRTELTKTTPNETKARNLHVEIQKLNHEMSNARFEDRLKNPSAYKTRGNRKSNLSPAEKAKMDSLKKLRDEMQTEFNKDKPNESKLRSLNKEANVLKTELGDIRFENRLKNPTKGDARGKNKQRKK